MAGFNLLFVTTTFVILFEQFLRALMATSTFSSGKVMDFFINVYSNHRNNKTSGCYKNKYFNPDCVWVLKHNYAFLLLRMLIVTITLATTRIIANVTGRAQAIDDAEKMLKKQ